MKTTGFYQVVVIALLFLGMVLSANAQQPPNPVPVDPGGEPPLDPAVRKALKNTTTAPTVDPKKPSNDETNTEGTEGDEKDGSEENKKRTEEEEQQIKFDLRQSKLPDAKIWGQQFFRDQSISLFTRSRDIKAIDSYLLGIGDELAITIWGATDYSANVAIEDDGALNIKDPSQGIHIPRLYVKDMTFSDAKYAIEELLANHMNIRNSQVSIELNYSRSLTINITGEVFNPGAYTIPAVNTAFNALVAAGGPSQIGSVRIIRVVSSNSKTRTLDVYKFMSNPKVSDEFFLQNNDYIYVPLAQRVVQIEGAIERPFFYELIDGEDLVELIDYAGGLTPDAYRRNIQIIRYENDEERLLDIDLAEILRRDENFTLKDGDRIKINPIEQAFANYVTVKGAVKLPGTYQLESNTHLSDVLSKSGIVRSAVMERIYVKRLREDLSLQYIPINIYDVLEDTLSEANITLRPFDEIEVKYKADFIDKYNVKIFGAVREPGSFEFSTNLMLSDVLYMANGLRRDASNSYIEISRLVLDAKGNRTYITFEKLQISSVDDSLTVERADSFALEPYDQIFVRRSQNFKAPENVNVVGEVTWPGEYTLASNKERVLDVLERAGKWTDIAFLEGAKLIREGEGLVLLNLEDLQREGKTSRYNYVLRGGDQIIIPKLKDLVSIGGRINHPAIKEQAELATKELDLALERAENNIAKKEILLEVYKKEIANPQKVNVPFHSGKRANFYIQEYGAGIDRKQGGRQRLVFVRYANGKVKKTHSFLFFKVYPKVEKGAMVYVGAKERKIKARRNPVNWYKVVTDSLALIVSGLSIYVLINAATRRNNNR